MWIVFGLLLPLLLFTAVCVFRARAPRAEYLPQICAGVVGIWALAAIAFLIIGPDQWPDTTQIAWTGVEQKLGRGTESMTIGGSEQTAVTAWPNGSFAPLLRIEPAADDDKRATLLISKGGAFAVLPKPDRLVNGIPLEIGQIKTIGGYRFELERSWLVRYRLRIVAANGDKVADMTLSRPGLLTPFRILSLEYLNTRSKDDTVKNRVYDNWSRPVLIGITHNGLRILERNSLARVPCELPCSIRLRWRRGSLNLGIDRTGDSVRVRFARPWRNVSPLPEKNASGGRQLVVTRQAQPGDYAFVLPLGGGVPDPRAPLWILDDAGKPRFAGGEQHDSIYGSSNERAAVTSETEIAAGRYRFRFATSTDILHPGAVVVHLALALLCMLAALVLITPRTSPEQRWIVCGIAAVVWVVLAFRVALSVRYALTPQFVDGLSVKGLVLSLFAATLLPSLILLEGRLRCDGKLRPKRKQDGARAAWQAIGLLAAILVISLLQLNVADNLWPALPTGLRPGLASRAPMMIVLLVIAARATLQIRHAYFAGTMLGTPLVSYESFAERASGFWRAIGDRRHKAGMRWYLTIAGLFAALLIVLALLPGTRLVQEVFAPLVLTLLPALLWLSSAQHFRELVQRRTHNGFASTAGFWTRMLFWAVLTVLLPVFIFPAFIRDPGSVLATLAVFVPLLLVLAFAERAGKPAIAIAVCLLGAFSIAGASYLRIEEMYPVMKSLSLAGNVPARVIAFKRDTRAQQDILRFSRTLEEAYTHTWENKAIAHEGGMRGLGFGNAPTRRSHVAQDTLQYDSVFSFFVLGEHGFVGGVALLLIYLIPVALFLIVTQGRLTLATSFGIVIAAAFFAEAWFHAAMNSGAVPFAGRNLPLLSVHSGSDMLKWLCLFIVAAGTPFWSVSATRQTSEVIVPERRRWMLNAAFAGLPLVLVALIGVTMYRNVRNTSLSEPFTWDTMLESVSTLTRDGKLSLNNKHQIVLAPDVATDESLLAHQVKAFNQLPLSDRVGEARTTTLTPKLLAVRTPLAYVEALRDEASLQLDQPVPYPPLFRLVAEPEKVDDYGVLQMTGSAYRIEPNSEFNTRISFRPHPKDTDIPRIFLADQPHGTFLLQGTSFSITVSRRAPKPHEDRTIGLQVNGDELRVTRDSNPLGPRGDVLLRGADARGRTREEPYFRFSIENGKHLYIENQLRASLRIRRGDQELSVPSNRRMQVFGGDRVHLPAQTAVDPAFSVFETDPPPLVGPAWVMGRWQLSWDPASPLAWTPYLATALDTEWERLGSAEARKRYQILTLNSALQREAQDDVAAIGYELHTRRLRGYAPRVSKAANADRLARATQNAHPPRVAMTVISIPDGAVLAMAGWPRTTPGMIGRPCTTSDSWCPPTSWIDRIAPAFVRARYGGDRNFDRIEMGSSTKPLLAAAALAVDPKLENLRVTGPSEVETELFGITIDGKGWETHNSPRWTDFATYLAQSDNRYQVRLGFLAIAGRNPNGQIQAESQASPSMRESLDGVTEWKHYPRFPTAMKFSSQTPNEVVRIDDAKFAQKMRTMLGAGVRQGDFRVVQSSFWTRNGEDDVNPPALPVPLKGEQKALPAPISRAFDVISPEMANLELDYITTPREYISLLLGGNENRWSNVQFAGAFATTITGHPVMPYIVRGAAPKPAALREHFPKIASRVRPGLESVIQGGTAAPSRDKLMPPALARIPGVRFYAKTGTLGTSTDGTTTSRLVVAIVRWADEPNGVVKKGIVLSLVAERAQMGDATRWLAQYVTDNQEQLARYLQ